MSNGKQTWMVERIDRRREHEQAREDRTARQKALAARAASLIAAEIGELPAEDQGDFAERLAAAVRVHLVALHGAAPASSMLGKQAYEAARDILPRKIASAAAEQAFARLTKPANDDRSGE